MPLFELMRSRMNNVLLAIQEAGLDPADFRWTARERFRAFGPAIDGGLTQRLYRPPHTMRGEWLRGSARLNFGTTPPRKSRKAMVATNQHPHHGRNEEYKDEDDAGACVGEVQELERGGQQNERQRPA